MVLARKQYQLIKEGLSEDAAYEKALEYVESLENEAFLEMKNIQALLSNRQAKAPFLSDDNVAQELEFWRNKLRDSKYKDLELVEQGELDYFVQTKILKWNEVERERRMKEPVFAYQFENLLRSLFPVDDDKKLAETKLEFAKSFFDASLVDKDQLYTEKPFYLEEYIAHLRVAVNLPDMTKWTIKHKERLNRWILETLALRHIVDNSSAFKVQMYVDELRSQYFPMLNIPNWSTTTNFQIPTVNDMKRLLYSNGVGYKKENLKTYVKRYYRLPILLFPVETVSARIYLESNEERLHAILNGDNSGLTDDLRSVGLGEASFPEVRRQLSEFLGKDQKLPEYSLSKSTDGNLFSSKSGTSALDELLQDSFDDPNKGVDVAGAEDFKGGVAIGNEENSKSNDDYDDEDGVEISEAERQYVAAFKKSRSIPYLREKDAHYSMLSEVTLDDIRTAKDVAEYKEEQILTESIVRARLQYVYEEKEALRRQKEWAQRGIRQFDISQLPAPLPL